MNENNPNKLLVQINKNSIFYKIKNFFRSLFNKTNFNSNESIKTKEIINTNNIENNKNSFWEDIKNIENEETKILKLQKQYRSGEINEDDLTQEQVNALCNLYDKQIEDLRKSNQIRKQKLLQYRRKMQTDN